MRSWIRARRIASTSVYVRTLAHAACCKEHFCSNRVAWTFWTGNQLQAEPVVRILDHVAQEHRRRIHHTEHYIHVPIIEQIAKCRAPRRHYKCQPACSCSRNLLKFRSIHVAKQQRTLCPRRAPILFVHTGVNMPVRKKKIEQSIIVVIQETRSPAEKRD